MQKQEEIGENVILTFPYVYCACGCKTIIKAVDARGRHIKYVNGHNRRKRKLEAYQIESRKIKTVEEAIYIIDRQWEIINELQDIIKQQDSSITGDT